MDIRKAENTKNDCDLVFSLSNDSLVRVNSFSTKPIEYDSHCNWYKRTVSDNNTLFFLVFDNNDFVGQIRFNREAENSKSCIISLSITEPFRGKHISSDFLMLGINELHCSWIKIHYIIAEVKKENVSSNKLFEKNGFILLNSEEHNKYKYQVE